MGIDTNLTIRNYFEELYLAKKQVAKSRASSSVKSLKLSQLAPPSRVVRIVKELDLLQLKIAVFPREEYVNAADDLAHLFNYFSGNLYFCRLEEEDKLLEALVLNETFHLLWALLQEAMAQLPPFTNANFMNNDLNVVFYELNQQPWGCSVEEYTAMRCWQSQRKQECVHLESTGWMARLIESVKDHGEYRDLVRAERDRVTFFYTHVAQISPRDCISQLSQLRIFCPDSIPENIDQWHESFCRFVKGQAIPYALSPGSVQLALRDIQAGKISPAPFCGWSLMKYNKWLDDVLQGKTDLKTLPELAYEKLFEKNLTIGPLMSEETIAVFNKKMNKSHDKS